MMNEERNNITELVVILDRKAVVSELPKTTEA